MSYIRSTTGYKCLYNNHCIVATCKELKDPLNGRVDFPIPVNYKSEAMYTCNPGFSLMGVRSRECLGDGVWSGIEPTCVGKSFERTMLHICICTLYHCACSYPL